MICRGFIRARVYLFDLISIRWNYHNLTSICVYFVSEYTFLDSSIIFYELLFWITFLGITISRANCE